MNEIEDEILKLLKKRDKIVFDIGSYKGNFTKNFLKNDNKLGYKSKFYMFDPNPNVKKYLTYLLINNNIKYFGCNG